MPPVRHRRDRRRPLRWEVFQRYEDGVGCLYCRAEILGEAEPRTCVSFDEFGKKFLVNGNLAGNQCGDLARVAIDENDFVSYLREARTGHQAHVS